MDDQIIREIVIELQEMEERHQRDMSALRKKLRIALGDFKPRKPVVEFLSRDGKTHAIKKGGGGKP